VRLFFLGRTSRKGIRLRFTLTDPAQVNVGATSDGCPTMVVSIAMAMVFPFLLFLFVVMLGAVAGVASAGRAGTRVAGAGSGPGEAALTREQESQCRRTNEKANPKRPAEIAGFHERDETRNSKAMSAR
jgi:hypothetical protein